MRYFSGDDGFRQPLMTDEEGLYITVAQMNFFFNRKNGLKKFEHASPEFMSYYNHCRLYNLIYDMLEKDPDCAKIYWDEKNENLAISFPMKGKVAKELIRIKSFLEEDDEDSDNFGVF